jgi:hypothetical protein
MLLLISVASLCYLAAAVFYHCRERAMDQGKSSSKTDTYGLLAVIFAACSQLLYLTLGFAWCFHWMQFYPGNPIQTLAVCAGLPLSVGALIIATFGRGLKSAAAISVSVITIGQRLLSVIASSTI